MPKIIDVIIHGKYKQISVVLDSMPVFLYDRTGNRLEAEDDGFYKSYGFETPLERWKAFGGSKFDIPIKDGTVEKAVGQWWDVEPKDPKEEIINVGIGTLERLKTCYVFMSGRISKKKLTDWLEKNNPSEDYHKYDPRRKGE